MEKNPNTHYTNQYSARRARKMQLLLPIYTAQRTGLPVNMRPIKTDDGEGKKKVIIISTNYYFCKLFVTARKRSILKYANKRDSEGEGGREIDTNIGYNVCMQREA